MRGATVHRHLLSKSQSYFNPRAPCGARQVVRHRLRIIGIISIHAPHAGRDLNKARRLVRWQLISIHAPHAGRDRRARRNAPYSSADFNPRAPCGARRAAVIASTVPPVDFNPRAPCGARRTFCPLSRSTAAFQSTRPMRGATLTPQQLDALKEISIHAPHAGRDAAERRRFDHAGHFNPRAPCGARPPSERDIVSLLYFNPRAPCGARLDDDFKSKATGEFQSTRPMRGATGTTA